jgi:hypothetical protein
VISWIISSVSIFLGRSLHLVGPSIEGITTRGLCAQLLPHTGVLLLVKPQGLTLPNYFLVFEANLVMIMITFVGSRCKGESRE